MIVASLALALLGMTPGKIDINLKDLKDGDTIARPRTITVTVDSTNPINQVEFYVGDRLRSSDTSTPYEFQIDPLNEAEGKLTLTFAAYSSEGENNKKSISVTLDPGTSKGVKPNVDLGNEALTKGALDEAIYAGRVALKADSKSKDARLLLARAYLRKGVYDKAQTFAEDALAADPNFDEANEVLSGIGLRKAFMTLSGGNRKETLESIKTSLNKGVAARRKVLDRQFDAAGQPTAANLYEWCKMAIRAGRYQAAANALSPVFHRATNDTKTGNLLAYAQIRDADYASAARTIDDLTRTKALDGYSYALKAILLTLQGKTNDADAAMSEAIGSDPDNLGIKLSQTYIVLTRGRFNALASLVQSLSRDEGQRPEVNYYLSILLNKMQSYTDADKRFLDAVLAEPTLVDMLVERGNQSLSPVVENKIHFDAQHKAEEAETIRYQTDLAGAYYNAALIAKPDSPLALTALCIYYSNTGRAADALSYADAAVAAGPNYPAAQYTAAMVYAAVQGQIGDRVTKLKKDTGANATTEQRNEISKLENEFENLTKKADAARKKSGQLDPAFLEGRFSPTAQTVFAYFVQHGRIPLLVMP